MKPWPKDSTRAFSLFELLIVIIAVFILTLLLLPALLKKVPVMRGYCADNLKEIGLAFIMWAGDNDGKFPMQVSVTNVGAMEPAANGIVFPVFQVMSNELNNPKVVICPEDKQRVSATNFSTDFNNTKISYFVGMDASTSNPAMFLSGDRNITNGTPVRRGILELTTNQVVGWTHELHNRNGNILLTDGSVRLVTNSNLDQLLQNSGVATNRLLMP